MDAIDALDMIQSKPTTTSDLIAYGVMIVAMIAYFWLIEKYS